MKGDIVKAFLDWQRSHCGCAGRTPHETLVKRQKLEEGGQVTYLDLKPKPDHEVCLRERNWRKYCRLRDRIESQERDEA